jgi:hypothetical protein
MMSTVRHCYWGVVDLGGVRCVAAAGNKNFEDRWNYHFPVGFWCQQAAACSVACIMSVALPGVVDRQLDP